VGLILLKCVLGGAALAFVYAASRATTARADVWVPVFVFAAATIARYFVFRPQLFTFACFALFVAVLFRHLLGRRSPLWLLPVVMLLWVNTHGGFLAGLGAVGLSIVIRAAANLRSDGPLTSRLLRGTGRLWATAAALVPTTFINPYGWRLWVYVVTEVLHGTNRRYISEWAPVSLTRDVWSAVALTIGAALVVAVGVTAQRRARHETSPEPAIWALSCLPLIVMAYVSVRHVPLAFIWMTPVLTLLGSTIARRAEHTFRMIWRLPSAAAVLSAFFFAIAVMGSPRPVVSAPRQALGGRSPCQAAEFLRVNRISGNLFTPLWWGSYFTWQLYPQIRVSMDGRNISLFPDEMVVENLEYFSRIAEPFDAEAPFRYDTQLLIVPTDRGALVKVSEDQRWRQIYSGSDAVLFARVEPRNQALLSAAAAGRLVAPTRLCSDQLD
jgi:hypothetical protein